MLLNFIPIHQFTEWEQYNGGFPYASLEEAQVIIADESQKHIFGALVALFQLTPNKAIESLGWFKNCLDQGEVVFTPLLLKNPGGRRVGQGYV